MSSWVAISKTEHARKYWLQKDGYAFAAKQQTVPVLQAELPKLIPHYVLGFLPNQMEQYELVALLGIGRDKNLYVTQQNQWLGNYVPAVLRSFPFALHADQTGKKVLCIDIEYLSDDSTGKPLFEEGGDLSKESMQILNFISQCEYNRQATLAGCKALADAGLIEAWPIAIQRNGADAVNISGLYRVNEEELNKLDDQSFKRLRDTCALTIAYAQMFSSAQIEQLVQRVELLGKESPVTGIPDIFSEQDTGTLNFDFLNNE